MSNVLAFIILSLATAFAVVRQVRRRWLVVRVAGASMLPTFKDRDVLLVRTGRTPRRGDVVVFQVSELHRDDVDWMVKRVVAVSGDPVPAGEFAFLGEQTVPPGHVLVRGDNPVSRDSRHFGFVSARGILGVASRRLR